MFLKNHGDVWFMFSNNNFQFLNNISRISTHFFTNTYFHKYFKQQFSVFKHTYQTGPMFLKKKKKRLNHVSQKNKNKKTPKPCVLFFFLITKATSLIMICLTKPSLFLSKKKMTGFILIHFISFFFFFFLRGNSLRISYSIKINNK